MFQSWGIRLEIAVTVEVEMWQSLCGDIPARRPGRTLLLHGTLKVKKGTSAIVTTVSSAARLPTPCAAGRVASVLRPRTLYIGLFLGLPALQGRGGVVCLFTLPAA